MSVSLRSVASAVPAPAAIATSAPRVKTWVESFMRPPDDRCPSSPARARLHWPARRATACEAMSSASRSCVSTTKSMSAICTSGDVCVSSARTAALRTTSRSAKRFQRVDAGEAHVDVRVVHQGVSMSAETTSLPGWSSWLLQLDALEALGDRLLLHEGERHHLAQVADFVAKGGDVGRRDCGRGRATSAGRPGCRRRPGSPRPQPAAEGAPPDCAASSGSLAHALPAVRDCGRAAARRRGAGSRVG